MLAIQKITQATGNKEKAAFLQRFFRTGAGEYAAGDQFLGIVVPEQRRIAKQFRHLSLADTILLLQSQWHEERLIALFILVDQFARGDQEQRKTIFDLYLKNTRYINNWDLVDSSAPKIVGAYLLDKSRDILYQLVKSDSLWERRIAIVATQFLIGKGEFDDTLKIAAALLNDKHDLIHKACGWMLREVGKKDRAVLEKFLARYAAKMPRTMLRYAIEHFDQASRQAYLKQS